MRPSTTWRTNVCFHVSSPPPLLFSSSLTELTQNASSSLQLTITDSSDSDQAMAFARSPAFTSSNTASYTLSMYIRLSPDSTAQGELPDSCNLFRQYRPDFSQYVAMTDVGTERSDKWVQVSKTFNGGNGGTTDEDVIQLLWQCSQPSTVYIDDVSLVLSS